MTSEKDASYSEAYVWIWLPGATEPVVAGLLSQQDGALVFNYGRSYLARPDAAPFAVAAAAIRPLALLLVLPAVPVLVFLVAQRGLVFTLSNLAPRLSRIDPVAAAGRPDGL